MTAKQIKEQEAEDAMERQAADCAAEHPALDLSTGEPLLTRAQRDAIEKIHD